jgi:hypothetical protein
VRHLRFLLPILVVALAAFVAGNASGSERNPVSPVSTKDWKVCLDERTADYLTRDVVSWPGLEECFRQP